MPRTYTGALRTGLWSVLAAALGVVIAALGGCEHSADKSEIRRVFLEYQRCIDSGDGTALLPLLTEASFERNDRALALSTTARKADLLAMEPVEIVSVLAIRTKLTRKDLKDLTGRQLTERSVNEQWFASNDFMLILEDFQWWKDGENEEAKARVTMLVPRERYRRYQGRVTVMTEVSTDMWVRFVKTNGAWLLDGPTVDATRNRWFKETAAKERVSIETLLVSWLTDQLGEKLPENVWQPLK